MSIFEIQQSKQDKEFVMKSGSMKFDVFSYIFENSSSRGLRVMCFIGRYSLIIMRSMCDKLKIYGNIRFR